jgi:hypothetical protein
MRNSNSIFYTMVTKLTITGGLGFWVANLVISLTPLAAEYRSALSIAYFPMLIESLVGGLFIGFCISNILLRFFNKIPGKNPIIKSGVLTFIIFLVVNGLVGGPSSYIMTDHLQRYFVIGTIFNIFRFSTLGLCIGIQYGFLNKKAENSKNAFIAV